MKSVMYHYVREYDINKPYFRFLHKKNFIDQLNFFESKYGFISKKEFIQNIKSKKNSSNGVILTFDDSLSCHYDYVYHILKERGLWGIFYIPTAPYSKNTILNVHKIHILLGIFNPKLLLNKLKSIISEEMIIEELSNEYSSKTYTSHFENYSEVLDFKKILNYYVYPQYREFLLNSLCKKLRFNFNNINFYVPEKKLVSMVNNDMILGSHTVNHHVMRNLDYESQEKEIVESFDYLDSIVQQEIKTYCHPYGGDHSFNENTIEILGKENVDFSFSVEYRDVDNIDLIQNIQKLPRFDCNQFEYGKIYVSV